MNQLSCKKISLLEIYKNCIVCLTTKDTITLISTKKQNESYSAIYVMSYSEARTHIKSLVFVWLVEVVYCTLKRPELGCALLTHCANLKKLMYLKICHAKTTMGSDFGFMLHNSLFYI